MTKKQFGIIFTLMALIVCVGVLSAKLNTNGVVDPTDLGAFLSGEGEATEKADGKEQEKTGKEDKDKDKETLGTQDYFYGQRITKEELNEVTTDGLKAVIADVNTAQDKKDLATVELQEKIMLKDKEGRIEVNVKNKGFEDVLCFIEGNKVRVVLKVEDELTEEQTAAIQEIVEDVSSISDVIIEPKK